jgi:tetratricopeptide (TPR) repeat protein/CHAT domain-containing protein
MKPLSQFLSIVAILALVILNRNHPPTVAGQSTDETALRAVAQKYVEVWMREDIVAMMSLWSMRSKDVRQGLERMLEGFAAADRIFSNVNVSAISVEGNRAVLLLSADLSVRSPTGETSNERFARNLALVREAGTWKIWQEVPASQHVGDFLKKGAEWKITPTLPLEDQFATALLEVGPEDQHALLSENGEMLTPALRGILLKRAASFQAMRLTPKAIEAYRLAQRVAEAIGDKPGIGLARLGLAGITRDLGSLSQALEEYEQTVRLFEEIGDGDQVGAIWSEIGKTQLQRSDHLKALESYSKAAAAFEKLNQRARVADIMNEIGMVHYGRKEYTEAIAVYEKSLRLNEVLGRTAEAAMTFKNIGNARYYQEDHEGAIAFYLKALAGFEAVNNWAAISETMRYVGGANFTLGSYDSALEYYQKALIIDEGLKDRRGTAASLFGIGSAMYALGDYAAALDQFYKNLELLKSLFDTAALPDTLRRIGLAHLRLRSYGQVLTAYEQCLSLYEEGKDRLNAALLRVEIGNVHFLQRDHDAALDGYLTALSYFESLHNIAGVAACYGGIANVHSAQRRYDSALEFYEKSLPLFESLGDKEQIASTLGSIAGVHYARTDYTKSLEFADRASSIATQAGSRQVLWQTRFTAGSALRALNQPDEARRAFSESIDTIEAIRALLTDDEAQPFFGDKNHPYLALMELLLDQDDIPGAFTLAERVKSHSLWDMLRCVRLRITRGMSARERDQESQLSKRIVYLSRRFERDKQLSNPTVSLSRQLERSKAQQQESAARLAALEARVSKARQEYASFARRLYAAHPQLKSLRGEAPPLKAEEAGRVLDPDTAFLSFVVAEGKTFLFVLTRESKSTRMPPTAIDLRAYVASVSQHELAGRVTGFRDLIEQRSTELPKPARELYDLLMAAASRQLNGKAHLMIAPHAVLWDLPFQALQPSDGHYLIEDYTVGYTPSLTALREMIKPTPAGAGRTRMLQLLAFGDPQLAEETVSRAGRLKEGVTFAREPAVDGELKSLTQVYGVQEARFYTGAEATEERLKTQVGRNRILQLSTRAVLSDTNPLHSPVLMARSASNRAEDGLLQPWEIFGLNLRSNVVVMSACEPPISGSIGGESFTGWTWAWFATGSTTTFFNQGKAETDEASFLPELHRNLRRAPPAEALRQSAMKMLKGRFADPVYWSRYILLGKGK